MPTTFDVRIWRPRVLKGVKKTTYNPRWVVGPKMLLPTLGKSIDDCTERTDNGAEARAGPSSTGPRGGAGGSVLPRADNHPAAAPRAPGHGS